MNNLAQRGGRLLWNLFSWKIKLLVSAVVAIIVFALLVMAALAGATGSPSTPTAGDGISNVVPSDYRSDVLRAGSVCDLITPAVIAAQIDAESGWNPTAISQANAQGIAQFIPSTWATQGKDGDGDGIADVNNPRDAIWSQGNFMCALVAEMTSYAASGLVSGDILQLALAAYNAGSGAVLTARGIPNNGETESYVLKIIGNIEKFQGALNGVNLDLFSADVKDALDWAISIASDDSHYYLWGGAGPKGYDCSGLVLTYAKMRGVNLPRTADQQRRTGRDISEAEARPGDLIFWSNNGGVSYYHTAIYLGNGQMVSADDEASGINVEPIWGRNASLIVFTTHWH